MNKRKWLFVCVAALFATAAYSQISFADSSTTPTTSQTTDSSTTATSDTDSSKNTAEETADSSTSSTESAESTSESSSETSEKLQEVEDTQVIKQNIHIQKIISSNRINNQGRQVTQQEGVNGAKFIVYDITNILEEMTQDDNEKNQSVEIIESKLKDRAKKLSYDQLKKVTEGETQTIDDQEGVIDFSIEVPANKKQAYYIVNESSPENISNSEDIVLLVLLQSFKSTIK
ncbi:pilin N-terminal domain-containing protein [Enterococcus faecium]|uniref:pilin N-terminal domain-containing protein n=1 Tax=Enterococcus faecium TaxID=1352 RepID=UPI0021B14124|nr:pilin N-terminal domain-containing protein [Enterococcus faecium]